MKSIIKIAILCLAISLVGCSKKIVIPPGQEVHHSDSSRSDSVIYIEKPIPIPVVIRADSTMLEALFGCDSLNNVYIKRINEIISKGPRTEIIFRDNTLYYKTNRDSLQAVVYSLKKDLKQRTTTIVHDSIYIEKAPVVIYQNGKFAKFTIWWFFGSLVVVAIYLIFKLRLWRLIGIPA